MRSHSCFSRLAAATATFLILLIAPAWGQEAPAPIAAPMNPAFVDYINKVTAGAVETESAEGHALGLMPCPIALSHLTAQELVSAATSLPALWDLRTQSKLTPVRNQSSCGSCWSFGTYGSLESWFMPSENLNFSENNLKNTHGFDWTCCSGGNHFLSSAYLGRWSGPVDESADPYAMSCTSPSGLSAQKHVQDVIFFPDRADANDNATIKQAVYTLGGVYTTMYYADPAFNDLTESYYYTGSNIANHSVTIVGWDDSYDRTRFPTLPPANGAFIVKNSWGAGWGQSGYFYASYFDTAIGKDNAMFEAESATNYSRIYQYDPLGWVGSLGYSTTTASFANVFTAVSDESLAAASWYSASAGSTYTLYVYLDPTSGPINPAGPVATKSGTLDTAGYHTVRLDASVGLSSGHKFSVVVRLTTPGYYYPIPYEFPYSGYSSGATSSPGQSYISSAGTSWTDITSYAANSNVCLKAFTIQGGTLSVAPSTGLTSVGNQGGPFSPSSAQYTLSNPGSAAINWSATHLPAAGWVTVSPTSGTLASDGSTTVTVSINFGANALAVGNYSDTITFTNTSNGAGSTSRSVQLAVSSSSGTSMVVTPPDNFSSAGPAGGPFSPDKLQYTVSNVSNAAIDFTVTHDIGTNWLTCYNTLPAHTNTSITALINQLAGALAPGVYQDTIAFTNLTNGQGNTTRIAQLTVTGAALSVTPSDGLVSSGNAGGSFSPSIKHYTLTNTGGSPINWTASHGGSVNWVSLSGASGTLAGGASTTVAVSVNSNANSLAAGVYSDTISFANATNGLGNTTRPVSLTVYQGALSVAPADGLSTTGAVGGPFTPSSKQYTLANTGNAPINWTASHDASVNWVTLSSASGTLAAGTSTTLTVSIGSDANSLPGGTYSDTVAFTNTTNGVGNTSRPVSLVAGSKILMSVAVSPSALLCPSTDPRQLRATAYFSDLSTLDVTTTGTWTSSKTSVCRVSTGGVITPVTQGTATVTCSYSSGGATKQATCAVNVSYQTIYYLYMTPASYTFYARNPVQFACQGRTASGFVNLSDACQWSSSAPAVATVNFRGLVTPVSKGTATITAQYLYNGKYMSSAGLAVVAR